MTMLRHAAALVALTLTTLGVSHADPAPALPPSGAEAAALPDASASAPASAPASDRLDSVIAAIDRVPDNPAIDLLGAEDLKVVRPGSLKDLGVELRGLYQDGKIVPEIAIEVSPWALTLGKGSSYADYLGHWGTRLLRRFTMSLATTSIGDGDARTTLGALGVRLRLIDDADWRLNRTLVDCAENNTPLPDPPSHDPGTSGIVPQGTSPQIKAAVEKCITDNAPAWNATQLALGAAISSAFPQSKLRWDLNDLAAWASYATALGRNSGLTLGLKYLFSDARTMDAVAQTSRHTAAAAATYELRGERLGLLTSLGAGSRWSQAAMSSWNQDAIGLVSAELQLQVTSDMWLAVRFSAQFTSGDSDLVSFANLKWNYDITPQRSR